MNHSVHIDIIFFQHLVYLLYGTILEEFFFGIFVLYIWKSGVVTLRRGWGEVTQNLNFIKKNNGMSPFSYQIMSVTARIPQSCWGQRRYPCWTWTRPRRTLTSSGSGRLSTSSLRTSGKIDNSKESNGCALLDRVTAKDVKVLPTAVCALAALRH